MPIPKRIGTGKASLIIVISNLGVFSGLYMAWYTMP